MKYWLIFTLLTVASKGVTSCSRSVKVFVNVCESPSKDVSTPGTTIISPNYPNGYPWSTGRDCQITLKFQQRVSITFEDFSVYGSGDCDDHDDSWLEVHNGGSQGSLVTGKRLCGYDTPRPMQSTGNSMTIVFHAGPYNAKGFKIVASQMTL